MKNVKVLAQHLMDFHGYQSNQLISMTNVVIGEKIDGPVVTNSVATFGSDGKIWVRDYTSEQVTKRSVLTHEAFDPSEPREVKPLERPAKREIEDIFGDDWGTVADCLGKTRAELKESFKDNYDDINKQVVEVLFGKDLLKGQKQMLSKSFDKITTESFGMQA